MGINNRILYGIIAIAFAGGMFTIAYAGPVLPTITLAGNTHTTGDSDVDGDLNVDGTITGAQTLEGLSCNNEEIPKFITDTNQFECEKDLDELGDLGFGCQEDQVPVWTGPFTRWECRDVSSNNIEDETILFEDINQNGCSTNEVMKWDGTNWSCAKDSGSPIGEILIFPTPNCPDDFALAEGSAISRTTFADLFAVIGTMYGDGDGSTTFNLPDYRGYFLRGVDRGVGNDPDAASRTDRGDGTTGDNVGTKQGFENAQHNHDNPPFDRLLRITNTQTTGSTDNTFGEPNVVQSGTILPSGSSESRPINIGVNFCIRYQ